MRRPQGCSTDEVPLGAVLFPASLQAIKGGVGDETKAERVPGRLYKCLVVRA